MEPLDGAIDGPHSQFSAQLERSRETFYLKLTGTAGATIGDGRGVGTIVDEETARPTGAWAVGEHRGRDVLGELSATEALATDAVGTATIAGGGG